MLEKVSRTCRALKVFKLSLRYSKSARYIQRAITLVHAQASHLEERHIVQLSSHSGLIAHVSLPRLRVLDLYSCSFNVVMLIMYGKKGKEGRERREKKGRRDI